MEGIEVTDLIDRCKALGLNDGPIVVWVERIERLESENATLRAEILIKDAKFARLCADYGQTDERR